MSAEITVSASRIENFIGITVGGGGRIEGSTLLAEQSRRIAQIQAEREQANARGEIFDRLFRGFPSAVMDIRLTNISLSDKDPNTLIVQVEYSFKPTFIRALEGTLKALATMECAPVPRAIGDWWLNTYATGARSLNYCARGETAGSLGFMYDDGSGNGVCLTLPNVTKCYSLAPGTYCASCDLSDFGNFFDTTISTQRLLLFWRFLDANGQLANKQYNCFGSAATLVLPQIFVGKRPNTPTTGFIAGFDLRSTSATIEINSSLVDLSKATIFVAVPGWASPNESWNMNNSFSTNQWITSLVPDTDNPVKGGCQLLDRAAEHQLLTQSTNLPTPGATPSGISTTPRSLFSAHQTTNSMLLHKEFRDAAVAGGSLGSPSFDCSKERAADAVAICSNVTLANTDRRTTAAFKQASLIDKAKALKIARAFLAQRRACGSDANCIAAQQVSVLQSFKEIEVVSSCRSYGWRCVSRTAITFSSAIGTFRCVQAAFGRRCSRRPCRLL